MAAPYGNRNAEKWSFKKAVALFNNAIELSNEIEKSYLKVGEKAIEVESYKYDFIGEIAAELGTFREIFNHLSDRFRTLQRLNKQLHTNIERNCYSNVKKGAIKEATGIVNLKSNHKWTDRIDHTTKEAQITSNPDYSKLSDEEVKFMASIGRKLRE